MKTLNTLIVSALCGFALCVFCAPFVAHVIAAEFTGPREVAPNYKLAKTTSSAMVWEDAAGREWLRVQGNAKAVTVSEQWGPKGVSIETTREPLVARTDTGWIIAFK